MVQQNFFDTQTKIRKRKRSQNHPDNRVQKHVMRVGKIQSSTATENEKKSAENKSVNNTERRFFKCQSKEHLVFECSQVNDKKEAMALLRANRFKNNKEQSNTEF